MVDTHSEGPDAQVGKISELIKHFRLAMLTSVDENGKLVARPMTVQESEFDGDLWFLAARDSSTLGELRSHAEAGVTMSSTSSWVSLSGTASEVDDRDRVGGLWNPMVDAWFPDGPDDPNVVLIRFTADSAEYWESPGGRVGFAISFAKAKVTGERYRGGESGPVDLSPDETPRSMTEGRP